MMETLPLPISPIPAAYRLIKFHPTVPPGQIMTGMAGWMFILQKGGMVTIRITLTDFVEIWGTEILKS